MMNRILCCLFACGSLIAGAQTPDRNADLVKVEAAVDHKVIHPGQDLRVTVTLTAGSQGAWLPNHFGDFSENCQSGFSADIFTLEGRRASDATRGCAADILSNMQPVTAEALKQYVFLKPGERRVWHTAITQITRTRGTFEIKAEYISAQDRIHEVARLPEVHGLMVMGRVRARSVRVRVR